MKSKEEYRAIFAKLKASGKPIQAYDVKARMKVNIENPELVFFKNGRGAIKGKSPKTGIAVQRII